MEKKAEGRTELKRGDGEKKPPQQVEVVALYGTGHIETSPDDKHESVLQTEKLNGCSAVLLFREYADGTREGQMTHFPPFFLERHLTALKAFAKDPSKDERAFRSFLYLERGRAENLEKIDSFLEEQFGDTARPTVQAYDRGLDRENAGMLSMTISPKGPVEVGYETGKTTLFKGAPDSSAT